MEKIYNFRSSCTKNRVKKAHFSRWPGWTKHFWLFYCTYYLYSSIFLFFIYFFTHQKIVLIVLCVPTFNAMHQPLENEILFFYLFFFRKLPIQLLVYVLYASVALSKMGIFREGRRQVSLASLPSNCCASIFPWFWKKCSFSAALVELTSFFVAFVFGFSSTFRKHRLYAWVYFSKRYFFVLPYAYSVQYIIGCFILFAYV